MTWMICAVLFLGTFIRSAFEFGEAPIAVLISISADCVALAGEWKHVEFHSALHLVAFTLIGIPLGLWMLVRVPEQLVKCFLGTAIAGFSCYCIFAKKKASLPDNRHAWLFGLCAGVLGGTYGVNGPPVVIYGALRHWPPERFRATMQGYFLPTSTGILIGYSSAGLWVPAATRNFLSALPFVAAAIFAGRAAGRRLSGPRFFIYVHTGPVVVGAALAAQAFL